MLKGRKENKCQRTVRTKGWRPGALPSPAGVQTPCQLLRASAGLLLAQPSGTAQGAAPRWHPRKEKLGSWGRAGMGHLLDADGGRGGQWLWMPCPCGGKVGARHPASGNPEGKAEGALRGLRLSPQEGQLPRPGPALCSGPERSRKSVGPWNQPGAQEEPWTRSPGVCSSSSPP